MIMRNLSRFLLMCLAIVIAESGYAVMVSNKLTWSAPTTRADGKAYNNATETAKFKIYATYCDGTSKTYETTSGTVFEYIDSYDSGRTPCVASYQLTTVDKLGLESAKSAAITVSNVISPPAAPGAPKASQM